jgi:hypothetical protein
MGRGGNNGNLIYGEMTASKPTAGENITWWNYNGRRMVVDQQRIPQVGEIYLENTGRHPTIKKAQADYRGGEKNVLREAISKPPVKRRDFSLIETGEVRQAEPFEWFLKTRVHKFFGEEITTHTPRSIDKKTDQQYPIMEILKEGENQ